MLIYIYIYLGFQKLLYTWFKVKLGFYGAENNTSKGLLIVQREMYYFKHKENKIIFQKWCRLSKCVKSSRNPRFLKAYHYGRRKANYTGKNISHLGSLSWESFLPDNHPFWFGEDSQELWDIRIQVGRKYFHILVSCVGFYPLMPVIIVKYCDGVL